jgi:hypothetical protein
MNPATRIGRIVLFEGGDILRLSRWEWALFALGLKKTLPPSPFERYPGRAVWVRRAYSRWMS